VGGGFVHQALALEDSEAVLLVNGDDTEASEGDVVFDEGVSADDELGFASTDAIEDGGFFRGFQAADEEFDAIAGFGEDAPRGKKMLDGQNFGGAMRAACVPFSMAITAACSAMMVLPLPTSP